MPGSASGEPLLRLAGVSWQVEARPILRQVSLEVRPGEFVAVMGRNGAGKSSLLDIMAGVRAPSLGTVHVADRRLQEWSPRERARLIAHLPQAIRADLSLTAGAVVLMGRYAASGGWFESTGDHEAARQAMTRCDCLEFEHRTMATLSGGERQRVFLAACVAQQSRLWLLDEPATFLDIDQQIECFSRAREAVDAGTCCVAVTHDINLALTFCTRIVVLDGGVVRHDRAVAAALSDPSWLSVFSSRLHVDQGRTRTWIGYR